MKTKRFLVAARCATPNPRASYPDASEMLTHALYRVVPTREQADAVAATFQHSLEFKHNSAPVVEITPVKPRKRKAPGVKPLTGDAREAYERDKAIAYARWLAARDGVAIVGGDPQVDWRTVYPRVDWRTVYSAYHKRRLGTREAAATFKRAAAVEWGHDEEVYNTRKDGRRGAFLYKQFVCETRIEIPHWDFEHPPVELCESA